MTKLSPQISAPAFGKEGTMHVRVAKRFKFELKKITILLVLFSFLFASSFYIVNLFDIKPKVSDSQITAVPSSDLKADDEKLKNMLGSNNVGVAAFSDWAVANNLSGTDIYSADPDGEGLANYLEYIHGTDPNNADTDGDKFSDKQEIISGYDPDAYGETMTKVSFRIEKIGVVAPMVWSKTDVEADMLKELENGITHFIGTASPGQKGNAIISGHSSNYIWAKGDYNYVFKNLNDLENGDVIVADTVQKNGRIISYKYMVSSKLVVAPDDELIFANTNEPSLTLSTCWPLGTNFKRMIVKAELMKS
ncbi:MAG: sortase family protein [uncultured bacterium]|nr:MAG: sortase family protein [uncultured bacterium]